MVNGQTGSMTSRFGEYTPVTEHSNSESATGVRAASGLASMASLSLDKSSGCHHSTQENSQTFLSFPGPYHWHWHVMSLAWCDLSETSAPSIALLFLIGISWTTWVDLLHRTRFARCLSPIAIAAVSKS